MDGCGPGTHDAAMPDAPRFDPARLGPDDPPPFSRIEAGGSAPRFVLVCDHASNAVPAHMARLGLNQAELDRHIGWDIGAAAVTEALSARLDAPAFLAGYSRLIVDCNRPPGAPTAMPATSDGTEVPANRALSPAEAEARMEAFFRPYHAAIAARLDRCRAAGVTPVLVAVHSFTPVLDGVARPWEIGLLWEHDDRLVRPLADALAALRPGIVIGHNKPYAIRGPSDHTIPVHGQGRGLPHIEIELRQDLITEREGAEAWAETLAAALERARRALAPPGRPPQSGCGTIRK